MLSTYTLSSKRKRSNIQPSSRRVKRYNRDQGKFYAKKTMFADKTMLSKYGWWDRLFCDVIRWCWLDQQDNVSVDHFSNVKQGYMHRTGKITTGHKNRANHISKEQPHLRGEHFFTIFFYIFFQKFGYGLRIQSMQNFGIRLMDRMFPVEQVFFMIFPLNGWALEKIFLSALLYSVLGNNFLLKLQV